jgi:aminoglycoside phosphotransferase (APT) family kinase protein
MQKVRKGEELNEQTLKSFLRQHQLISDVNSPMEVAQFSTGASNLTYLLKIENRELVLRRPPKGAIKRGHDMGREFKVLTGLNNGFDKAPKAYAYTEDKSIIGASFYVMEKVEGIIIDNKVARQKNISATEFPIIFNSWLDTLVELHDLDYKALGLEDLGRPNGYVERQVRNWSKQYLKAATEDIPEAPKVMTWLDEHQPTEYHHCLIHNDYKYDNVVFEDDSWQKINAVLDWEMCTLGDPFMDLGAAIAYWITANDDPMIRQAFQYPTMMAGNPSRLEVVEQYAQKSGRPINHLVFYYAFGLFKNAVIVQQIYYRYAKGLTTNKVFSQFHHLTKLFCKLAWKAIQSQRIELRS